MRESLHRYLGIASLLLVGSATFAACGGLDPRKVTRGPRFEDGGEPGSNAGSPPVSSGGSNGSAGDVGNPFGGQLFTGGAPPVLEGPPEVVEVDPADMATDVDVDSDVALLFSEAIDSATVNDDSVQLLDGGLALAGEVSFDAQTELIASFEPSRRLSLAATYEVSVSTDVTDRGGAALAQAFTSTFTTRDGTWEVVGEPFVADATQWGGYDKAFVTVDGRGNTLVVWPAYDPIAGNYVFWGRWHRVTTGWQDAVQLSVGAIEYFEPHASLAADESGDAIVVWKEQNAVSPYYSEVYARRYVNGSWSAAPEPLHGTLTMDNMYGDPHVSMRDGRIVVWWSYTYQGNGYSYDYVYGQSATAEGPFATNPAYIRSAYNQSVGYGSLAIDGAGNGLLVFSVNNAGVNSLEFGKYVAATDAWEEAAPIPDAVNTYDGYPSVAVDDDGAAMVVWRNAAVKGDLTASRYTKARGFATPVTLDELDAVPVLPYDSNALASDGTDFFISWVQLVGATGNVYGAHYSTANGAWSSATLLSDGDTGVDYPPRTVADRHGNAMSLWVQGNIIYNPPDYLADYSAVEFRTARFLASESAWQASQSVARGLEFDPYHGHDAAVGANGIVALLNYRDAVYVEPTSTPAEPWLNVFR